MRDFDDLEDMVLRRFYAARNHDHAIPLPVDDEDSPARVAAIAKACHSLASRGLIDWTQIFGATVGFGRITAAGIIVVDHETRAYEFERRATPAPLGNLWRRAGMALLARYRERLA